MVFCYASLFFMARRSIAELLCGGVHDIELLYRHTLPLILSMHFLDGLFLVYKFFLTVRQKQFFGTLFTLVNYYLVGLPIGIWLAFRGGWGIIGLWTGCGVAVLLGCVAAGTQVVRELQELTQSDTSYRLLPNSEVAKDVGCEYALNYVRLLGFLLPGVTFLAAYFAWASVW
jgi:Na+-driven multidrug efflux pump